MDKIIMDKIEKLNTYLFPGIRNVMKLYINQTRKVIKGETFDDLEERYLELSDEQKEQRLKLIDIKDKHTDRCCNDIENIMHYYGFHESWISLAKFVAVLHDFGRFIEGENCSSFTSVAKELYIDTADYDIKDHASLADRLLFDFGGLDDFYKNFELEYWERQRIDIATRGAIKYHQTGFPDEYAERLTPEDIKTLIKEDVFEILLTPETKQETINKIKSFMAQIMRDVDKIDILYQNYTGEMPVLGKQFLFKTHFFTRDNNNPKIKYYNFVPLSKVAATWHMTEEQLLKYNPNFDVNILNELVAIGPIAMDNRFNDKSPLYDKDLNNKIKAVARLSYPTDEIDPACLTLQNDVKEMFYNNQMKEPGRLAELQDRLDWSVITGMWWRLGTFLNDINFVALRKIIKDNNLLDKILAQYPDKFKPLVIEAFEYAKRFLIDEKLNNQGDSIYDSQQTKSR